VSAHVPHFTLLGNCPREKTTFSAVTEVEKGTSWRCATRRFPSATRMLFPGYTLEISPRQTLAATFHPKPSR